MLPLGGSNVDKAFRIKIEAKSREFFNKKKPYCVRCAMMDYKDKKEQTVKEFERKAGYIQFDKVEKEIRLMVPKMDLNQYGADDRFELVKESDAMEPSSVIVAGNKMQRQVKTGVNRDFKCKVRGCGITLNVNDEDKK